MSTATATNGAATEAAFAAIAGAFGNAGSFGSSAQDAFGSARLAGESWLEEYRAFVLRSLDAVDAAVNGYLELTRSLATAVRFADQAMGQAQRYAATSVDLTSTCTNAARELFGK